MRLKETKIMKKVVHYDPSGFICYIVEGEVAIVYPIDHPDTERVSNKKPVRTSTVVSYDKETGIFETLNTIYIPKE